MIDEKYRLTQLFDFYGELLTDKQKAVLELYLSEDLGLVEIAENLRVSRQAVYDHVHKASLALVSYEEKLGLLERFQQRTIMLEELRHQLDTSTFANENKAQIMKLIEEIINF